MSQWTHVIGSIQCSWTKEKAIELLGKPVLWNDAEKLGIKFGTPEWENYYDNVWAKAFENNRKGVGIPMGSEGSIDWYFSNTADDAIGEGSIISIEGDLRDFGGDAGIKLIIDWFVRAASESRFATLTIKDEFSEEYVNVIVDWHGVFISKVDKESKANDDSM